MRTATRTATGVAVLIVCLAAFGSARPGPILDNGLARTPPMGWNSWNRFHCDVSSQLIRETADAMVESGMRDAGYEYVVIDDCWQVDRDASGRIVADPERFPEGMKALADYVHSKGLKFGLYTDAGRRTCQGRPGSYGYEEIDARTYAEWGVDYTKVDWCNSQGLDARTQYAKVRDALANAGRPIVFSICEWGTNEPWDWAPETGHLWRTTGDIGDRWNSMLGIVDLNA
ncbi:MAG: glycoside hydrolase family 27 protein, partial [Gemmatimonadota bacterium]